MRVKYPLIWTRVFMTMVCYVSVLQSRKDRTSRHSALLPQVIVLNP